MSRNAEQEPEVVGCPACRTISLTVLGLDLQEPVEGWERELAAHGIELIEDDLGRLAIRRWDAQALIAERRGRETKVAAQRAEQAAALEVTPVPAGIPAREGLSALESVMAGDPNYQTVGEEFGRPPPRFLEEQLAEGQRQAAAKLAEAEAVRRAKKTLDGRDG